MSLVQWIVLLVALQRVAEVAYAERNTRILRRAGGIEIGAGHYPLFVLLHSTWLAALWFTVPADAPVAWSLLALFVILQALRVWVIVSLGRFWTTRIITVPDAPLVRSGPYRWCRHPNYAIVAAEIALLPLAFGAWALALGFSVANALLLRHRIRAEDRALAARRRAETTAWDRSHA
ncbi:MAG: hypothetical protein EA405_07650 [Rhodospirillales bacterium]|nr:MAG: hypothetical protein EA405_07650 [Rhodospirillales bacterium]TVS00197.1 MAG: hypothetical protein EA406_01440 [Rhodospirillales bacterium]